MKTVIFTAGPRGAGKSTYCEKVAQENPDIHLVSRDQILMDMFGSIYLDVYGGGHFAAMERLYNEVHRILASANDCTILVDCWNGFARERDALVHAFTKAGADRVVIWLFLVPQALCVERFMKRESARSKDPSEWWQGMMRRGCVHNWKLFYAEAKDLVGETRESASDIVRSSTLSSLHTALVKRIDITQLYLPGMPTPVPVQ